MWLHVFSRARPADLAPLALPPQYGYGYVEAGKNVMTLFGQKGESGPVPSLTTGARSRSLTSLAPVSPRTNRMVYHHRRRPHLQRPLPLQPHHRPAHGRRGRSDTRDQSVVVQHPCRRERHRRHGHGDRVSAAYPPPGVVSLVGKVGRAAKQLLVDILAFAVFLSRVCLGLLSLSLLLQWLDHPCVVNVSGSSFYWYFDPSLSASVDLGDE